MSLPFWAERELAPGLQREAALLRVQRGEPIEYILGNIVFLGCPLFVDRRVLIPRQETEMLVDLILQEKPRGKVWDLCTGSGCIGIALKKNAPHLEVSLSDLSLEALEVAGRNARLNEVEVALYPGDLLSAFVGKKADLIVCNPPYVSEEEYAELDPSVKEFEPKMALVGGAGGLHFYQRLAWELPSFLEVGGKVFFEIGWEQGERVMELFRSPQWVGQKIVRDLHQKERFFTALFSGVYPSFLVS